jgi:hypothetical protein
MMGNEMKQMTPWQTTETTDAFIVKNDLEREY